jgi:hypothetical protein
MLFELLLLHIAVEYATDLSQTTVTYFSRKVCTYHLQNDLLNDKQCFALSLSLAFIWKISKATFLKHPRICSSKKRKHHRVSVMVNIQTKRHTDRWWRRDKQRDKCENSLSMSSSSSQTICKHVLLHKQCTNNVFTNNTQNIFFASSMQTSCSQTMLKHVILLHKRWIYIVFFSSNTRTSLCMEYAKHLLHKQYASIQFTNKKLLVRRK